MRVRHLTSVHPIGDNRIFYRESKSLADAGYDIAIIVGQPPTGPVAGVPIIGVGLPRNRVDRATRTVWKVFRAALKERAQINHLHDPELLWAGLLLKLAGRRVVYDVHEDAPKQIMNKFWIPWWAKRVLVQGHGADGADGRGGVRRHRRRDTVDRRALPRATRPPSSRTSPASSAARRPAGGQRGGPQVRLRLHRRPRRVQGLREIVATAALLPSDLGDAVVAGWFDDDELEREVRASEGWKRVDFLGRVTPNEVLEAIVSAHCGIVIDHPISNYLESYSTKMFEYMACGVPVVCSDFPLWVQPGRRRRVRCDRQPHGPARRRQGRRSALS